MYADSMTLIVNYEVNFWIENENFWRSLSAFCSSDTHMMTYDDYDTHSDDFRKGTPFLT